jgi:hypothetical protein
MTEPIHPVVIWVATENNIDPAYAVSLLLPDDTRLLSDDELALRAKMFADMYSTGLSLKDIALISGGLSRERVRQVMTTYGYRTRPVPGSKRWRDEKKLLAARAAATSAA